MAEVLAYCVSFCAFLSLTRANERYACDNGIFCQGNILHSVQMAKVFGDAKTFVDMRMKYDKADIESNFTALGVNPSSAQIKKFVMENFSPAGYDLEPFYPEDWVEKPESLNKVQD